MLTIVYQTPTPGGRKVIFAVVIASAAVVALSPTVVLPGFVLPFFTFAFLPFTTLLFSYTERWLLCLSDPWFYNRTSYNRVIDRCIFYSQLYHNSSIVKTRSAVVDNWYLFCVPSCTVYKAASVAFTVDVT